MPLVTSILAGGFVFLEGPRWHDGRLFLSDMHDDRVLAVGLDGRVVRAADDLAFPNGTVITPDGETLIVAETFARCLTAFDVAPGDGTLSNRRLWASTDPVFPDGICLDAEGAVWVASPLSNEVVRVREGGELTHHIPTGRHAIACMLG